MNKKTHKKNHQAGFTIIELMIATVVFTLVFMGATYSILEIGKKYYRGITQVRTASVTRSVTEEISQAIQYSNQPIKVPNYPTDETVIGPLIDVGNQDTYYFCIGSKRYTFAIDRQLKSAPDSEKKEKKHVLWVDQPEAGCAYAVDMSPANLDEENPSGNDATNGRELLAENMRISVLTIEPRRDGLWGVRMRIISGDDDLLAPNSDGDLVCEGSTFGTEYCAVSEVSLTVKKRL